MSTLISVASQSPEASMSKVWCPRARLHKTTRQRHRRRGRAAHVQQFICCVHYGLVAEAQWQRGGELERVREASSCGSGYIASFTASQVANVPSVVAAVTSCKCHPAGLALYCRPVSECKRGGLWTVHKPPNWPPNYCMGFATVRQP